MHGNFGLPHTRWAHTARSWRPWFHYRREFFAVLAAVKVLLFLNKHFFIHLLTLIIPLIITWSLVSLLFLLGVDKGREEEL